jgi:branched-chain amino acid transport system substrate-binding protein
LKGESRVNRFAKLLAVFAVSALVLAACGSSSSTPTTSGAAAAKSTFVIGYVASITGANASEMQGAQGVIQGLVDEANAAGGVDGHKLSLVTADDASSPTQNLTAVQSVVSKGAKIVIEASLFDADADSYLEKSGIPVIGLGITGPIWSSSAAKNFFPANGSISPTYAPYTTEGQFFKTHGATKVAEVGYNLPSTTGAANGVKVSVEHFGLQSVYDNVSLTIGAINFPTLALAIKQSGANGLFVSASVADCLSLAAALKQAGVKLKVLWLAGGYGQSLLTDKTALAAAQGAYINAIWAPTELNNSSTQAFVSILSKYDHYTGIPLLGQYDGYVMGSLAITGLKAASPNFTSSGIVAAMRAITNFTANGIEAGPVNFSQFGYGDINASGNKCEYVVQVVGSTFVPTNGGKPLCGSVISS